MNLLPRLRFTPYAWAKLVYLRDRGDTEVGGFGLSAKEDLLLVEDVRLVHQHCTAITVHFDDTGIADYFDAMVDQGKQPERFARLWIHTHPGNLAEPSGTDEETFARCFGRADWAVMFILASGGQTYARLRWNVGPGGSFEIPVDVDFTEPFRSSDHAGWADEYAACVANEWLTPSEVQEPSEPVRPAEVIEDWDDPRWAAEIERDAFWPEPCERLTIPGKAVTVDGFY